MAKEIGMTICKGIVVHSYLVCLLCGDSIPILCSFHFFKCFFVTCFCCYLGGGERYEWCLDGVVAWGR